MFLCGRYKPMRPCPPSLINVAATASSFRLNYVPSPLPVSYSILALANRARWVTANGFCPRHGQLRRGGERHDWL